MFFLSATRRSVERARVRVRVAADKIECNQNDDGASWRGRTTTTTTLAKKIEKNVNVNENDNPAAPAANIKWYDKDVLMQCVLRFGCVLKHKKITTNSRINQCRAERWKNNFEREMEAKKNAPVCLCVSKRCMEACRLCERDHLSSAN